MAKPETIKMGYLVAVGLVPGTAPRNCYVGRVEAVDEYGVRINLVDWDDKLDTVRVGMEDLFVTWASVTSILVCTEEEPKRRFLKEKAPKWKSEIESIEVEPISTED